MGTFGQPLSRELRARIAALVDRALESPDGYPPAVLADRRAVLAYATEALFAFYLGDDGAVYELDTDSSRGASEVTDAPGVRRIYEGVVARHPELAELLAVRIVDRVSPEVALLEGFRDGLRTWDEAKETREEAIARHAHYFATRIERRDGPFYVVQRLPSAPFTTFVQLHLVGTDPDLQLELHVTSLAQGRRREPSVESLHRGDRAAIAAFLRSPTFADTVVQRERSSTA